LQGRSAFFAGVIDVRRSLTLKSQRRGVDGTVTICKKELALRLVTRSDFDGLICAVLLKHIGKVDFIKFVHPKDLQDGIFSVTADDVLTNVPFVPGCGLWFDHHATEIDRVVGKYSFNGECRLAPSAARVVYDYFGGAKTFPGFEEMMLGVDKADSAQFTCDEILKPTGWNLLSFVMDSRTGLGRFRDYRISNYILMFDLIEACRTMTIDQILALPDVQERVQRYFEHDILFRGMVKQHSRTVGNVIISDLRDVDPIYCGNRFLVYAMHPEQNCSIWIVNGRDNRNVSFACGQSIINKSCTVDLGSICRQFGGGGHRVAGTCQVDHDQVNTTLSALIDAMSGNRAGAGIRQAA
jgi:oligoribonuclease NrnB/cAMP/cGMP phosphodiesterase (DHH superfamily)